MIEHATIGFFAAQVSKLARGVLDAEALDGILRAAVQATAVDLFDSPERRDQFAAQTVEFFDTLEKHTR